MKIITVTFHAAHNYGAVLQAYALQRYIKNTVPDEDVFCLDYRPDFLVPKLIHRRDNENFVKWVLHNVIAYPSRKKRASGFNAFINSRIRMIDFHNAELEQPAVFIVGSDQVWNKNITGNNFDDVYFLSFSASPYKYSYAASMGNNDKDEKCCLEIKEKLKHFSKVGVRELQLYDSLKKSGVGNIYLNVDPVFLLDKTDYLKIAELPEYKNYILVYTLETDVNMVTNAINRVKKIYPDAKIISIGSFNNIYKADIHYKSATPEQYLGLIAHAQCIISNSFHALAFSVVFDRDLVYIPLNNGRGGRIDTLLALAGIKDNERIKSKNDKTLLNQTISDSKKYIQAIISECIQ